VKRKFLFFSTRKIERLYNFIIPVASKHAERLIKKKSSIIYPKKYFLSFDFLFFLLKVVLNGGLINNQKFINLRYKEFLIGRYVLSHAMRHSSFYDNKIYLNYLKLKYLLVVDKILQNIQKIPKETKAVYIDHGMYLNGIYFQGFQKKRLIIYTNNYPKGFCVFDFRKYNNKIIQYSNLMALNNRYVSKKNILEAKKKLKKVLKNTTTLPWMKKSTFKNFMDIDNLKKATHLIYAHSFLEAQYMYGHDGFISYEDWLEFSIKILNNKNNFVIIKAHPSFYVKGGNSLSNYDINTFNKFKKKYSNFKNIIFIDYPLQNKKLLKILNKNTIIISRCSTAIIEALYFGYKVICSSATFWNTNKLKLCNTWQNTFEYKKLLMKPWIKLKNTNKRDFYSVSYDLFCKKSFNLGTNYFIRLISNFFDIPIINLENSISKKLKSKKRVENLKKLILTNSLTIEKF
tara:strand:- start:2127 stop:3500 length:1374 start_codon:yes stop_codon:yes gene_type:complete